MQITEKLEKNLTNLRDIIDDMLIYNNITDVQIENFLSKFEKTRYNILEEIKIYNKTVNFNSKKIETIDDKYSAELVDNVLKIYVPEVMPSYKNLKTQTYTNINNNVARITKNFANHFNNCVFIYVKVFDKILGWDIDNKCVKPIADALIRAKVIHDDTISEMFYCAKGEYSENPHSEIYVMDSKEMDSFLQKYTIR